MSIREEQCRKVCRILDDVLVNRPTERGSLCVAVDKAFEALIQSEQRTDTLKAEIKRMKRAFKTCINSDYYTGYMSALSAVEGYIAQWG